MSTKHLVSGLALASALAFAPAAVAQKPKPAPPTPVTPPTQPKPPTPPAVPQQPKPFAITLDAKPSTIVFSGVTTLSGRLSGSGKTGGVAVRLFEDTTRPYGDSFKPSKLAATANNGNYSFAVKPLRNTSYRVVAATAPPVASTPKFVLVRIKVGIKVSDITPRRGSLVRFSGSVFPAHDGRRVTIQRRSRSGRFITVVRTRLRDAGTTKSTYSRRVRLFSDGVYRVKVSGDGDHANGFSRPKTIDVHR